MLIKKRGDRIALYRSTWVCKGPGVPHGYTRQQYVGAMPAQATEIPPALKGKLSEFEFDDLMVKVCEPAREAVAAAEAAAKHREADPVWRLQEAARLIAEAAARATQAPVSTYQVEAVQRELGRVVSSGSRSSNPASSVGADPLTELLAGVRQAAKSVRDGRYGNAPEEGVRSTKTYQLWSELVEATMGEGPNSLMRALQARGYVKTRR